MNRFWANLKRNYEQGRISRCCWSGLSILVAIVLFGLIGPFFTDATHAQVGAVRPRRPPGADYFLGTDSQGRDMWTLLIYATPNTLKMGLIAGFIGVGFGTVLGLIAGQFGGWIDAVIRVISDSLLTVPAIAILVIIAGNIDRMSTFVMALVVASLGWMFTARTVRAQVLTDPREGLCRGGAGQRRRPLGNPVPRGDAQHHAVHRRELRRHRVGLDPRGDRARGARASARSRR